MNAKELTNEIMNLLEDMDMLDYDREEAEDELYYELKSLENRSTYGTNGASTLYAAIEMLVERSL